MIKHDKCKSELNKMNKRNDKLQSDNVRLRELLELIKSTPTEVNEMRIENQQLRAEKEQLISELNGHKALTGSLMNTIGQLRAEVERTKDIVAL